MPYHRLKSQCGYSLIELIIVVMIIGLIAGIAVRSLRSSNEVSRTNATLARMDLLASAIAGNPDRVSGGVRSDYGYVGDIGSLPPTLDALVTDPGGLATWRGPYVTDKFGNGGPDYTFRQDAWGVPFQYSGGASIVSTGSGTTLTRHIAASVEDLLYNSVTLAITDVERVPPGSTYRDSIRAVLVYPDGAGSYRWRSATPDAGGRLEFDSIPAGLHRLHIIYLPDSDTITRLVNVDPGRTFYTDITLTRGLH